jgi:hypothetical protein
VNENLNSKKVAKRAKISHKKLLMKAGLNKANVLRVITSDNHVIDIEKEKSLPTGRGVNQQSVISIAGRETNNSHHREKALKPGARGLFHPYREHQRRQTMPLGTEYTGGCWRVVDGTRRFLVRGE